MFPKHQRLTAGQVKEIFGSTKPKFFEFFKLYTAPAQDGSFRVATIIPKNLVRKAYARNRLRRRTYHALREVLKTRPTPPQAWLIIVISKPFDALSHQDLVAALNGAIN